MQKSEYGYRSFPTSDVRSPHGYGSKPSAEDKRRTDCASKSSGGRTGQIHGVCQFELSASSANANTTSGRSKRAKRQPRQPRASRRPLFRRHSEGVPQCHPEGSLRQLRPRAQRTLRRSVPRRRQRAGTEATSPVARSGSPNGLGVSSLRPSLARRWSANGGVKPICRVIRREIHAEFFRCPCLSV